MGGWTGRRNLIPIRGFGHFLPPTQQETKMRVVLFLPALTVRSQKNAAIAALEAGRGTPRDSGNQTSRFPDGETETPAG